MPQGYRGFVIVLAHRPVHKPVRDMCLVREWQMVGGMMVSWRALAAGLVVTAGALALPGLAAAQGSDGAGVSGTGAVCTPANRLHPGTPRSGLLRSGDTSIFDGSGVADIWCLPVTQGQRISVRVHAVGAPAILVAGGAGAAQIETCEDCTTGFVEPDGVGRITVIARETGNLLLVVGTDQAETARRYAVEAQVMPNPAPAIRALAAGAPVRGTLTDSDWIDPQGEGPEANKVQDVYTVQLRAGRPVEISMNAAPGNELLDPFLVLGRVGPDGRLIDPVTDDDSGPGLGARIRITPTVSGTYQLRARALAGDAGGAYTVGIGPVTAPPRPRATPLAVGQTVSGSIGPRSPLAESSGGDISRVADFSFNATEGGLYELRMVPTGFEPFVSVGTYPEGPGSDIVSTAGGGGMSDSGDGPQPSTVLFQADATGPLIVRVSSSPTESGSFQLALAPVPMAAHPAAAATLAVPGRAAVSLVSGGPRTAELALYQVWQVELEAGQRIAVALSTGQGSGDLPDPVVEVGRGTPAAFEMLAMDDDGAGFPNSLLRFTAPAAGRYLIRARGLSVEDAGLASLSVEALPPPPALSAGATQRGALEDSDERMDEGSLFDDYSLTLRAGEAVRIEMRRGDDGSELDPFLMVLQLGATPENGPLAMNDDMSPETGLDAGLLFVAPADGIYIVRAGALGPGQSGPYALAVEAAEPPPPPPAPTPLEPGTPVSGRLDATDPVEPNSNQNFDRYVFEAQAGETYVIELRSSDFDAYVRVGPAGSDPVGWAEDDDSGGELNSRLEYQVETGGPQVIRASALFDGVTAGTYQLTVTRQ